MKPETDKGKIIKQIINEKLKQIDTFVEDIYQHTQSLEFELQDRSRLLFYLDEIKDYNRKVAERLAENHKIGDE